MIHFEDRGREQPISRGSVFRPLRDADFRYWNPKYACSLEFKCAAWFNELQAQLRRLSPWDQTVDALLSNFREYEIYKEF